MPRDIPQEIRNIVGQRLALTPQGDALLAVADELENQTVQFYAALNGLAERLDALEAAHTETVG